MRMNQGESVPVIVIPDGGKEKTLEGESVG